MCFPATAALERLVRPLPEDRENKRIRMLEEPSPPFVGLDTFDMSCLNQATETVENDGQLIPMSHLGFPRIEWSFVAIQDDEDFYSRSLVNMDKSQSSINFKEETHSFLDRFFAGDPSNVVKDVPSSPANRLSSLQQKTSSRSAVHNDKKNTSIKHGRLVRSIALGSRLALLEHQLTTSSNKRFCHSMNS